ncbi:Uu.00g131030.m01.CDS01 [Anthostomella pinea]|uniref:Uu.00g131030.m01.CDS01 n=1 Tax=Anthostomella pinea TaxID=933095 RepID=A0AAI8VJX4_9PEZI|nr:Uu.00g131030.m01.CDS01 [Anthostomella pinea]
MFPVSLIVCISWVVGGICQTDQDWTALNGSVNGRLHVTTPLALPCYSSYNGKPVVVDADSCALIRANYTDNEFRAESPSGYLNLQDEMCLSDPDDQCILDNSVSPAGQPSPGSSCNQGSVPSRRIEVEEVSDIISAFAFAKTHAVPLVIKNSGHDFLTRNSQKGSLALWVHKLRGMEFHADFALEGCAGNITAGRAVTVATGVSTGEVIEFASEHNSTFVGGYSPTIAASGGWVLGGGHSVLSPAFGLGVDRVAQFKIVTPDGVLRVVNPYQHPDLFWALRGGGGGTFGVVLEATHRVEKSAPVAVANIQLPSNITTETAIEWIALMARESLSWGTQGWGGHAAGLYLTHMNPLVSNLTEAEVSMSNATSFALAVGGTSVVEVLPDFLSVWNKYVLPGATHTSGTVRMVSPRLAPRKLFENAEGIQSIVEFISSIQDLGFDPRKFYCPVGTPFVADNASSHEARDVARGQTSVNSAWYDALWFLSTGMSVSWNASYAERLLNMTAFTNVTLLVEDLTGEAGGGYTNEANIFTQNWRESWWGDNYPRLLEVKQKYDPDRLLKCWKCVGFEDSDISSERFRCQGKLQGDIDGVLP